MGWSNASQGFADRLGVTLYADLRTPWPAIRACVRAYCERKAQEANIANWIAVSEGSSGGLFVTIVNRSKNAAITDAFLEPPSSPHRQREGSADPLLDGPQTGPKPAADHGRAGQRPSPSDVVVEVPKRSDLRLYGRIP